MVAKKVETFGGMVPAVDDRLLPDNAAARSENTWLYSGAVAGINAPKPLRTLTAPSVNKVYRIPNNFTDSQHLEDAVWMEFTHIDTDVIRSLVIGDTFDRYYHLSPTSLPRYNTKERIAASDRFEKSKLHFNGVNGSNIFLDTNSGGASHIWTAHGGAHLDTSAFVFGPSSGVFDGVDDYIDTPAHPDFDPGDKDFAIEIRFQVLGAGGTQLNLMGQCDAAFSPVTTSWLMARLNTNVMLAACYIGTTLHQIVGTTQFTNVLNTGFHKIALVRTGTSLRMFIDGVQEGVTVTGLTGALNRSSNNLSIGRWGEANFAYWNGRADEFRISIGTNRGWSTNYTPPIAPYPDSQPFLLGIPAPAVAPVVVPTGGSSSTTRTSAYVYTWVSAYGEEGPPSPATIATGKVDASWDITLTAADPLDLGVQRNLEKVRIYRTVTSAAGVATFFFVAEQVISDTTYSDTQSDAVVSANATLASTTWTGPPLDLQGWVSLPNGIVAGFRTNEIWFCEPYRLHAWPAVYALAVDFPVVGLGAVGQTLVVCTQAYPIAIQGIHPSVMSQYKLASLEPCLSRGSILSSPEGVYYASPNGLVKVANNQAVNITANIATKEQWQKQVTKSALVTLRAARLGAAYYGFGSLRSGVFEETAFETTAFTQEDFAGSRNGLLIDPNNERVAFNVLSNIIPCANVQNDAWTGELFVIRNGVLSWIDIASTTDPYEAYTWRSKIFQTSELKNFGVFNVHFDLADGSPPALNPTRDVISNPPTLPLAADRYGYISFYADGNLVVTRELRTSGQMFRIPAGFKAKYWQFVINARVKILSVEMATSAKELGGV